MTDLQAALALPQLDRYADVVEARRKNAAALSGGLAGLDGLVTPVELPGRGHVWHQYTVRVTAEAPVSRDELIEHLGRDGIGCGIYYPRCVMDYACYRDHPQIAEADVPVARRTCDEVVSLPVHPHLGARDLDRVVTSVRAAFGA
jgi:dTDP-4-amino-4,6-dideoxygalactose transaminase